MAFPALEVGQPGNPVCPNKPTAEASLWCPGSKRLLIFVSANAVMVQLGYMPQGRGSDLGSVVWQPPKPFMPCAAALEREFDAVRVYNYTSGAEAQVLLSPDDR